jgi:very-short-patch-repair endonuclease
MAKIARARVLRRKATWAEKLMWSWLRDRRFNGWKFRRQHPIGPYYIDFFCEEARLAIELDGSGHAFADKLARDREREQFLIRIGIKVLRYANRKLRVEKQTIRDAVFSALHERAPRPANPDRQRA